MISVVIATNKRAEELKECLDSLEQQTLLPDEVIIAHGGEDFETKKLVEELIADGKYRIKLEYFNFGLLGAATQRNKGVERVIGDIVVFLDDDIVCQPDFIKEITEIFKEDIENAIGGVSGTIVNQTYTPLNKINKRLFDLCVKREERSISYAGKLVGPAVNFLPEDSNNVKQQVDWLPSGCCAYRKNIFLNYRFNEDFKGYSFIEDVELSSRIGKKYKLMNTTKGRCYHKDLGGKIHRSWRKVGKMQVLNRWYVMTKILKKETFSDKLRFFYYQLYCVIAETKMLFRWTTSRATLLRWWGRALGCLMLLKKPTRDN